MRDVTIHQPRMDAMAIHDLSGVRHEHAFDPGNRAAMANLLALSATQQPQQALPQENPLQGLVPVDSAAVPGAKTRKAGAARAFRR